MRSAPVMDRSGSAFLLAWLAWSAGLGAALGDGDQRMSVISLEDYLRAVLWLADQPEAAGPYNVTIPTPTTNAEFSDTLARALHRPRVLKVPAFLLKPRSASSPARCWATCTWCRIGCRTRASASAHPT